MSEGHRADQQAGREPGVPDEARLPLSFNQEFLCMFDFGDGSGPFGARYHLEYSMRLTGAVDVEALRGAFADVVRRHEPLRTRIVRDGDQRFQLVLPAGPAELEVRECPDVPAGQRTRATEVLLNEMESGTLDPQAMPLLRGVLMRFDERDSALVLMAHHMAADGLSMRILARDIGAYYAARRAGVDPVLPPLREYRDFVAWEREQTTGAAHTGAVRYWAKALHGARLTALVADHPRSANLPPVTAAHRFTMAPDLATDVGRVARQGQCSAFMVLLAAYCRLVSRLTGVTDVVVPTHTPGRGDGRFNDTVGSFFNFRPLRVDLSGNPHARELLLRTRQSCLPAYAYDIPARHVFEVAPDLMAPATHDNLAPVSFQLMPAGAAQAGSFDADLAFVEINPASASVPVTSDIPDGALWSLSFDMAGHLSGTVLYRTNRFDERTIVGLVAEYRDTVRALLDEFDRPVSTVDSEQQERGVLR